MKNNYKKILYIALSIVFWLLVWEIFARIVDFTYFLPSISETFAALVVIFKKPIFYKVVSLTLLRVVLGLVIGIVVGFVFAVASHHSKTVYSILSPIISIIKATPVATFIILLYVNMKSDTLTVFIGFLMVMPIIWQNLIDAYSSIDKNLVEVAEIYGFSFKKRMRVLVIPAFVKYLIPAIITSVGLAWKSEVAAEIIAYTTNSIGQQMNMAQYAYDTPTMFAWTLVIITISILLERGLKALLLRYKV